MDRSDEPEGTAHKIGYVIYDNDDKPYSYNYSNDGCYISLNADQYAIITSYDGSSTFKYNADKTVSKSSVSGQALKLIDLKGE